MWGEEGAAPGWGAGNEERLRALTFSCNLARLHPPAPRLRRTHPARDGGVRPDARGWANLGPSGGEGCRKGGGAQFLRHPLLRVGEARPPLPTPRPRTLSLRDAGTWLRGRAVNWATATAAEAKRERGRGRRDFPLPTPFHHSKPPFTHPTTSPPPQVIQPINGDPFIGMLETPVTSSPLVATFLSSLPAYRTGVSPLLRGVEVGLAHGLLLTGPFIKLGPLRDVPGVAEKAGCASAAGLVLILTATLAMYGAATFQNEGPSIGVKTLSGRSVAADPLQSSDGWSKFTAGWLVGGASGVAWAYLLTQWLPYYS